MALDLRQNQNCGAEISPCGRYRYRLWRTWDKQLPPALWIMLNPSTADADKDDPTIRRVMSLTRANSMGGIMVVNLFAYRATDSAELLKVGDPIGLRNDIIISREARKDNIIIAGWGALNKIYDGRLRWFLNLLCERLIWAFGITKSGAPRHPLYLPGDSPLKIWRSPRESDMRNLSWFAKARKVEKSA